MQRKHRILIVNAYFDPWRVATPTRLFVPRAMAPYFLAGYFAPETCEVRVWDEAFHGALLDMAPLACADVVVFSGLTAALDRARQLAAYAHHFNPSVITVIGGPIPRALPQICKDVFDYACMGDVEEIRDLASDLLGADAVREDGAPRMDMARPTLGAGYVETTRYCNFACSFCSLSGEGRAYAAHTDASITRQLDATGKVMALMVLDNNFFGNNRRSFEHRVRLLGERWRAGQFKGWGALVTGDFFARPANIALAAENGCKALFSGVESLDPGILAGFNKKQSLSSDPLTLASACAEHGIQFDYGLIFDFAQQTTQEIGAQIDGLLADPRMPLPALATLAVPIVGTPLFDEALAARRLLPGVLLSDMDGQKLIEHPRQPLPEVASFLQDLLTLRGRRRALASHVMRHAWHWRKHLPLELTAMSLVRPLHRFGPRLAVGSLAQMRQTWAEPRLTYSATTDALRLAYRPRVRMAAHAEAAFTPLAITDAKGEPTEAFEAAREAPGALAV